MAWLLDTHTLIWALFEPAKLGRKARAVLEDPTADIRVSPVSYWEISLKSGLGKLSLPGTDAKEIPAAVAALGFVDEPPPAVVFASSHHLPRCPDHRDPFDRMLVWQAISCGHVLISRDRSLTFYQAHGLNRLW